MKALATLLALCTLAQAESHPWTPLFDGETLTGWTNANGQAVKEGKWIAKNGILSRKANGAGDLYSAKKYQNFEFAFEWKIEKGSNSGVKYRVQKINGHMLGLEYQILDDENHPDGKDKDRQTAALYDLKAPIDNKPLNPPGQWNSGRILVKDGHIQHFLNGTLVVEIQIPSEDWDTRFQASKYKVAPGFGVNPKGLLMLQDHRDPISFRNLRIREL